MGLGARRRPGFGTLVLLSLLGLGFFGLGAFWLRLWFAVCLFSLFFGYTPRILGAPFSVLLKKLLILPYVSCEDAKTVVNHFEKIQRDFLWGGGALDKRPHLVSRKLVCTDKRKGGLGLKSLAILNKALLGKGPWRFANDYGGIWRRLIRTKYGQELHDWRPREAKGPFGVGLWEEILKEADWISKNWKFRVGNGTRIRLWFDHWCGNSALNQAFPTLFELAANNQETMSELWDQLNGHGS